MQTPLFLISTTSHDTLLNMKTINLKNKKIGIWGFGIVGKSALEYASQFTDTIQIMDQNLHETIQIIPQTPQNITKFLEHNDIIIPSPGIKLHDYQQYAHKFLHELDIFTQELKKPIIAITGTVGKTTITSLLHQCMSNSIAAGNIGYAMLDLVTKKQHPDKVVLELSSYQLQYAQNFMPDIAIWTNFYPNHLDHHQNEEEYFLAKCNIIKQQRSDQIALVPYNIIEQIKSHINPPAQTYLFSETKPEHNINHPIFFIENDLIILQHHDQQEIIFNQFNQLPAITFKQNWLIIVATLYVQKIPLNNLLKLTQTLKPEPHRVEFIRELNGVKIFNDSKSTVWQATQQAVNQFKEQKIALFLGGISKGTDRTPLIKHLQNKPITVFTFGKEADLIAQLCTQYNIDHYKATTLQEALQQYVQLQTNFNVLLFSPAGASFDLFKNFQDRGTQFKQLILSL